MSATPPAEVLGAGGERGSVRLGSAPGDRSSRLAASRAAWRARAARGSDEGHGQRLGKGSIRRRGPDPARPCWAGGRPGAEPPSWGVASPGAVGSGRATMVRRHEVDAGPACGAPGHRGSHPVLLPGAGGLRYQRSTPSSLAMPAFPCGLSRDPGSARVRCPPRRGAASGPQRRYGEGKRKGPRGGGKTSRSGGLAWLQPGQPGSVALGAQVCLLRYPHHST